MSENDQSKKLHAEIMEHWKQYKELSKRLMTLEADIADLRNAHSETGQRLYNLYKISDNGLNGELQKKD